MRVRDWITVSELAELSDSSPAAVRRWVTGEGLPRRAGHPHNPWELDCIPVDESQGPRRRRIAIVGIKPSYLDAIGARAELDRVLARWPKGWSIETCEAPLLSRFPSATTSAL